MRSGDILRKMVLGDRRGKWIPGAAVMILSCIICFLVMFLQIILILKNPGYKSGIHRMTEARDHMVYGLVSRNTYRIE